MRKKSSVIWNISKEELQRIFDSSSSKSDVLRNLGFDDHSGNHRTLNCRIQNDNINLNKLNENRKIFLEKHRKNLHLKQTMSFNDIFKENSTYRNGGRIKLILLKLGLIKNECATCLLTTWQGKEITLQLDHVNGNNRDNRVQNLRLLCPNCHSQTPTYSGKKNLKKIKPTLKKCSHCDTMMVNSKTCGACNAKINYRKFDPSKEELEKLVHQKPFTKIAGLYHVSDNAVRKRCKLLGVNIPKYPPGYWLKKLQS